MQWTMSVLFNEKRVFFLWESKFKKNCLYVNFRNQILRVYNF
jgi:hypothetical protein